MKKGFRTKANKVVQTEVEMTGKFAVRSREEDEELQRSTKKVKENILDKKLD